MRERAEAATPGPWTLPNDPDDYVNPTDVVTVGVPGERFIICEHAGPDAPHIASWHPVVALAVADWLDVEAGEWSANFEATQQPSRGVDDPPAIHYGDPEAAAEGADYHARHALIVARAYLGEVAL